MKILLLYFFSQILLADDVILITADRITSDLNKSTSNVELFNEKKLEIAHSQTLPELLQDQSDVHIANGSIFLRGTDSSHALVVLDGVVLNDPSNPNRSFDISKLSLNNIKNIEILKGPQGLLYGANAIGGVIVLTSKTQASSQLSGSSILSYGTYQTVNIGVDAQRKFDIHQLSFGAEHFTTKGFSLANSKVNPNAEPDGEKRSTLNFHSLSEFNSHNSVETSARFNHDFLDLDNCGGSNCDDPNTHMTNEELFTHIQYNKIWDGELQETHFFYNLGKYFHQYQASLYPSLNKGEINTFGINHTNYISDSFTQNINFDYAKETNQLQQENENTSMYLYHKYDLHKYIYNFGLRIDHNKIFDNHLTYKLAAATKLDDFHLLRLAYSTGFKAPGLFQFLDPIYGNMNLKPELSRSLEIGHEWNKNSNQLHTTFFMTTIYDQFTYISSLNKTINSGSTYINGVEESFLTSFSRSSAIILSKALIRRPQILVKHTVFYQDFSLESEYVGKRLDVDKLNASVTSPSYFISHINYSYKNAFIKIKNIFNTEYEEVYGYGTGGRMITIGIKNYF